MDSYEKYYYYNREQDKVIECTWDEYLKANLKFRDANTIKWDKFSLGSVLKYYTISTICLMKAHGAIESPISPLIFETMIFSDDTEYDGYQERHTCLNEAKKRHDEIVLKILRREKINEN